MRRVSLKDPQARHGDVFEKSIAIVGGTFAGNKGAAGMLESIIINLHCRMPGRIRFDVISIYPKRDSARPLQDNVRIIPAEPAKLVLILPPIAILYALLGKLHLPRKFLLGFSPLRAIVEGTTLLDVSGISFVDDRRTTLFYNIACNLPAIVVGTPLVKLSQAMGSFKTYLNRNAAQFILSRARHVFARGQETVENLKAFGLTNVSPAADLAFILNEHQPVPEFPSDLYPILSRSELVIGVSPSQVLATYCAKRGMDLVEILSTFIDKLHEETSAHIAIIAHSLLEPEKYSRNNDYHICMKLYQHIQQKEHVTLVIDDLTPSQLRAVIARCRFLITCRFHSMISALCVAVPTLVLAWSHKYREVMGDFELDEYVIDLDEINFDTLRTKAQRLLNNTDEIQRKIEAHLPAVLTSARAQIDYTSDMIDRIDVKIGAGRKARKLYHTFFSDRFKQVFLGYSSKREIREGAASGGLVSSLIINQLNAGKITGAIACKTVIENEQLAFRTLTCTTADEVLDCKTSIYSDFQHASNVKRLLNEKDGAFAVVALPCQWKTINRYVEEHPQLRDKIGLRIGLWCGHTTDRKLIDDFLHLKGIHPAHIARFYFRKGLWRGETTIELHSGETDRIPFQTGYGLLQNLYIDCKMRCFSCADHFCDGSDVSIGDAWLRSLKSAPVKHSMAIAFTEHGLAAIRDLIESKDAYLTEVAPELAVQSQKRAIIWHTYGSAGRSRIGGIFGLRIPDHSDVRPRWNDYISAFLILAAYWAYSTRLRGLLLRLPWPLPYAYMLVQKTFLNF